MKLKRLHEFRQNIYDQMGTAKDAVFELMDAAILTRSPSCLAELSLSSVFRRQWHSTYEALSDCRPQSHNLLKLCIQQIPQNIQPILVADHSPLSRPDAVTLKERTYEYQPSSVSVNRPVGVGYGYSTVAYIPEKQGSWALPLSHERITSNDTPIQKVAAQLQDICPLLTQRAIVLFDSQ